MCRTTTILPTHEPKLVQVGKHVLQASELVPIDSWPTCPRCTSTDTTGYIVLEFGHATMRYFCFKCYQAWNEASPP